MKAKNLSLDFFFMWKLRFLIKLNFEKTTHYENPGLLCSIEPSKPSKEGSAMIQKGCNSVFFPLLYFQISDLLTMNYGWFRGSPTLKFLMKLIVKTSFLLDEKWNQESLIVRFRDHWEVFSSLSLQCRGLLAHFSYVTKRDYLYKLKKWKESAFDGLSASCKAFLKQICITNSGFKTWHNLK